MGNDDHDELKTLTQAQVCKLFQIRPDTLRRLSERAGVRPGPMKREEQTTTDPAKTEPSLGTEAPDDDELELLTQEQVCKLFQITPDTLRAREREGKAPPRIEFSERAIRYRRVDVRAFLEALADGSLRLSQARRDHVFNADPPPFSVDRFRREADRKAAEIDPSRPLPRGRALPPEYTRHLDESDRAVAQGDRGPGSLLAEYNKRVAGT